MSTLQLVPDGGTSGAPRDWTKQDLASILDRVDSPDGEFIEDVRNENITNTTSFALSNTPADFDSMEAVTCRIRYRVAGPQTNERTLWIRIITGTTVLAGFVGNTDGFTEIVWNPANQSFSNVNVNMLTINQTATKSDWDSARVEIRQRTVRNMGGDTNSIQVDAFEFNGTYVPAGPPQDAPTLSQGSVTFSSAQINWNSIAGATEYEVYRDTALIDTVATTTYTDNNVDPSTAYDYQVLAKNDSGSGPLSSVLQVTTSPAPALLLDMIWDTELQGADTVDNVRITLGLRSEFDVEIDWGDGSPLQHEQETNFDIFNIEHTYATPGVYNVKVFGSWFNESSPLFSGGYFGLNRPDRSKLVSIVFDATASTMLWLEGATNLEFAEVKNVPLAWFGSNTFTFSNTFRACTSLEEIVVDDTSDVAAFSFVVDGCSSLLVIPDFDMTSVTSAAALEHAFRGCSSAVSSLVHNISLSHSYVGTVLTNAAVETVLSNLADLTGMTSRAVNMTGVPGANPMTSAQLAIATDKNWTVTGHSIEDPSGDDEEGGSTANLLVTTEGTGTAFETAVGGSTASVGVTTEGQGEALEVAEGGSTILLVVTTQGSGDASFGVVGGSTATLSVNTEGQGEALELAEGGSVAPLIVIPEGEGSAHEIAQGGSTAHLIVVTFGEGHEGELILVYDAFRVDLTGMALGRRVLDGPRLGLQEATFNVGVRREVDGVGRSKRIEGPGV